MTSLILLKSMLFANALHKTKKRKKKTNYSSLPLKLCRICNQEKGEIAIFNNLLHPNIPEEIKNFSGVTIIKSDNMSKKMCKKCLHLLNGCIMFRNMCQENNKNLMDVAIKKEYVNYEDGNNNSHNSDESLIPSPFSDHNSDLWECASCGKEFLDLISHNEHLRKCTKYLKSKSPKPQKSSVATKKTFLCDICGKTSRSNANLLVHKSTHENVFPYKCDTCPYQGRTMDLLKVHKRSHMLDKPFKCTLCPKTTTTASNLAKHMRHVHSTHRPYKCTYCDKAFSFQHDMNRHIREIHLRQGTVECDICGKKFNTKKILHGHRWKIHQIKGEKHGRLPAYLQCQQGNETKSGNCDISD